MKKVFAILTNTKGRTIHTNEFNCTAELEAALDTMLARGYVRGIDEDIVEIVTPAKVFGEFSISRQWTSDDDAAAGSKPMAAVNIGWKAQATR